MQEDNYGLLDWIDINKIEWNQLSSNPEAMPLLEENQEKIDWEWLSTNPAIFRENVKDILK